MTTEEHSNTKPRKVYGKAAFRLQEWLREEIACIYSRAHQYHYTHAQVLEMMGEKVWKSAQKLGTAEYSYLGICPGKGGSCETISPCVGYER